MKKKVLIVQLKQIGDVLLTTPAIRALKEHNQEYTIDILTLPPSDQIFRYNHYINQVYLYANRSSIVQFFKLFFSLKKNNYDIYIDFYGKSQTALLGFLLRIPIRYGYALRGRHYFYNRSKEISKSSIYSVLHKLNLIDDQINNTHLDLHLDFNFTKVEEKKIEAILKDRSYDQSKKLVSIAPTSRREYKRWPLEKFAHALDYMIEKWQVQIIFICSQDEMHYIEELRSMMRFNDLGDYPALDLVEVRALLSKVDFHFGNDNGIRHFAIAAGKKTLAVFGQGKVSNWTPPNQLLHQAIEHDPGCKNHCTYPQCQLECINQIDVQDVKLKIDQILANL